MPLSTEPATFADRKTKRAATCYKKTKTGKTRLKPKRATTRLKTKTGKTRYKNKTSNNPLKNTAYEKK